MHHLLMFNADENIYVALSFVNFERDVSRLRLVGPWRPIDI